MAENCCKFYKKEYNKGGKKQERVSAMENIIEVKNLKKSFGNVHAVKDISFRVKEGELFAFLGINGAGKSTAINIMCGQLTKDGGSVTIGGMDLDKSASAVKRQLGVVFQNSVLDSALSVRDNLESRAALYGIAEESFKKKLAELCALLDLDTLLTRTVGKLSGGQRRRVDIARALLHDPKILILDEPTTGLDPQTRKTLWDVIADLRKKRNMTVFLTTHYMEEAAEADYIVILDGGSIVAEGTPHTLKNSYSADYITIYNAAEEEVAALDLPYTALTDAYRLAVSSTAEATALILKHPALFRDYEITKGKMDDVFLAATGKTLGEETGK